MYLDTCQTIWNHSDFTIKKRREYVSRSRPEVRSVRTPATSAISDYRPVAVYPGRRPRAGNYSGHQQRWRLPEDPKDSSSWETHSSDDRLAGSVGRTLP